MEKRKLKALMKEKGITQTEMVDRIQAEFGKRYITAAPTFSLWMNGQRRRDGLPWPVVKVMLNVLREHGITQDQEEAVLSELGFTGVLVDRSMVTS